MFPTFSWYSTPLAILYVCGLVFSALLFTRYFRKKNISDFLLGGVLLLHTYELTTYTIGFMAWYDNYPNTKINYFLISSFLIIGPLIYFYVKSVIRPDFKFTKKDVWHFVPQLLFVIYRLSIYAYDVNQSGFDEVQNGELFSSQMANYIGFGFSILMDVSVGIYLVLAIWIYLDYRKKTQELFSNQFEVELRWLQNFLATFTSLFFLMFVLDEINDRIINLGYKGYWWGHLVAGLSLIYLGVYGFLFDVNKLHQHNIEAGGMDLKREDETSLEKVDLPIFSQQMQILNQLMEKETPYLDARLTLAGLAKMMEMPPGILSRIINHEAGMNFNDYVNSFRVQRVKNEIKEGKTSTYSLLAIAFESGFNSKATFNRTFKKLTGQSPSTFVQNIEK